jgi:hypothetical protein
MEAHWKTVPGALCELMVKHHTRSKMQVFAATGARKYFTPEASALERLVDVRTSTISNAGSGLLLRWTNDAVMLPLPRLAKDASGDSVVLDWEGTLRDVTEYQTRSLAGCNLATMLHGNSNYIERRVVTSKAVAADRELLRSYGAAQWRQMQLTPMLYATKLSDIPEYRHVAPTSPAADRIAYNQLMLWMWLLLYHHMAACADDDDQWVLLYGSFRADFTLPASLL